MNKAVRVVVGRSEGPFSFFARELQTSGVYFSPYAQGLFIPPKVLIRVCKISLHDENVYS